MNGPWRLSSQHEQLMTYKYIFIGPVYNNVCRNFALYQGDHGHCFVSGIGAKNTYLRYEVIRSDTCLKNRYPIYNPILIGSDRVAKSTETDTIHDMRGGTDYRAWCDMIRGTAEEHAFCVLLTSHVE